MEKSIRFLIEETLSRLGLYSEDALELVWRTGVAESGYRTLFQTSGPAIGFTQCEPATIKDIWVNFAEYRDRFKTPLLKMGFDVDDIEFSVSSNIALQIAFCRLKYYRDSKPIPPKDDMLAQAEYWKRVYNSILGKGTTEHFVEANLRWK